MTSIQTTRAPDSLLDSVNGTRTGKKNADGIAAVQDRFMTLLVTQMRNQDPLNPMDNAQMTSQLAQLSTVSGIEKLNASIESLQASYQASQTLQAASMIGRGVLVPGSSLELADGQALMGIELPGPADKVQVTIRDAAGKAVHTIELERQPGGTYPLHWDGKADDGSVMADGKYAFEVKATVADQKVEATALSFGQVASVSTGVQGMKLNVPNLGALTFADIRQIL